ncbi:MAG: 4Fe-4S dicluster domain-containing protein [Acidobacteria bacterium]|nr:4Fe-4S dicluster domain-containing protein [Acidobacteriota bacterium]
MDQVRTEETPGLDRRDMLKAATASIVGVASMAGLSVHANAEPARHKKWGMVIDLQRCILCRACTIACKQENKTPPGMLYNPVLEEETGEYPKPVRVWFPRPCNHCDKPACMPSCPNDAILKREDGIVYIDPDKCGGAQECIKACPYEVPLFDTGSNYHEGHGAWNEIASPELGLMQVPGKRITANQARKCSFCLHKQDESGNYVSLPACAKTCMGKAIHFGDLNDPNGELQTLLKGRKYMRRLEDKGTAPNVYYLL